VASGAVTALGSTPSAEFAAVAVNGTDVFAVDAEGDRVVRFPATGGPGTTVIGSGLASPTDLAFRSATRLLVADTGTDRVLEYLLSGGSWTFDRVVLPASAGVQDPCALAIAPSGALAVAGCGSNDVVLVNLTTLAVTPLVAPGAGGLASPKDLAWSGTTLLAANPIANAIVYYDASGAPTGVRAQGLTDPLDGGLALSPDETRLAVASKSADSVIEFDAETSLPLRSFGDVCAGMFPSDVAYSAGGDLFVSCLGANSVNRIDGATGSVSTFVFGGTGGLSAPRSLGFGPNGNLFVSSASGEVLEYDAASGDFEGAFVDAAGNGGGPIDPYGFRFHSGKLYVTSSFTDSVKAYDAATGQSPATLVASGSGGLDQPTALDFGPSGDVFVASYGDDSVRRYHAVTGAYLGAFVPSGANGLLAPIDLAVRGLPEPVPLCGLAAGAALIAVLRRRSRA
jgi:WD40 repeat protein